MHVSTNVRKRKRMWLRILGAKSKKTRENFSVSRAGDVRRLWLRRVRQQFHASDHRGRPTAGDFNYFMLISSDNRVSLIPKDLFCLTSLFLPDSMRWLPGNDNPDFTRHFHDRRDINVRSGFNFQGNDIGFFLEKGITLRASNCISSVNLLPLIFLFIPMCLM